MTVKMSLESQNQFSIFQYFNIHDFPQLKCQIEQVGYKFLTGKVVEEEGDEEKVDDEDSEYEKS